MKTLILNLATKPRLFKQLSLALLDFAIFPLLLWLCYALRQFDLTVWAVPNLKFGPLWVATFAVVALMISGVYRFIVRSFNESFIVH